MENDRKKYKFCPKLSVKSSKDMNIFSNLLNRPFELVGFEISR